MSPRGKCQAWKPLFCLLTAKDAKSAKEIRGGLRFSYLLGVLGVLGGYLCFFVTLRVPLSGSSGELQSRILTT